MVNKGRVQISKDLWLKKKEQKENKLPLKLTNRNISSLS
jgi:hypothetical protein